MEPAGPAPMMTASQIWLLSRISDGLPDENHAAGECGVDFHPDHSRTQGHRLEFVEGECGADADGAVIMDDGTATEDATAGPCDDPAEDGAAEIADNDRAMTADGAAHVGQDGDNFLFGKVMEKEAVGDDIEGFFLRVEIEAGDGVPGTGGAFDAGFGGDIRGAIDREFAAVEQRQMNGDTRNFGFGGDFDGDISPATGDIQDAEGSELTTFGDFEERLEDGVGGIGDAIDIAKAFEREEMLTLIQGGRVHDLSGQLSTKDGDVHAMMVPPPHLKAIPGNQLSAGAMMARASSGVASERP